MEPSPQPMSSTVAPAGINEAMPSANTRTRRLKTVPW
jgi:hypothetical protein